jgi:hypothetical protein
MTKFAVAILLALTMPASAEVTDSANFLLPGCKALGRERESTPEWRRILCLAYIQGLVSGAGGKETCPPKEGSRPAIAAGMNCLRLMRCEFIANTSQRRNPNYATLLALLPSQQSDFSRHRAWGFARVQIR